VVPHATTSTAEQPGAWTTLPIRVNGAQEHRDWREPGDSIGGAPKAAAARRRTGVDASSTIQHHAGQKTIHRPSTQAETGEERAGAPRSLKSPDLAQHTDRTWTRPPRQSASAARGKLRQGAGARALSSPGRLHGARRAAHQDAAGAGRSHTSKGQGAATSFGEKQQLPAAARSAAAGEGRAGGEGLGAGADGGAPVPPQAATRE
jgi:hypothetical protein